MVCSLLAVGFTAQAAYESPAADEKVTVTVIVSGDGAATYEGETFSAQKSFLVDKGVPFTVSAVENELFQGFYYTMPDASWKFTESFDNIIAGTDMTITVKFGSEGAAEDDAKQVTFLTNSGLSYLWIYSEEIYDGDDVTMPEAPSHKNAVFAGWSFDKACVPEAAIDSDSMAEAIAQTTQTNFIVYAIYDAVDVIETERQEDNITLTSDIIDGTVYFDANIQVKEGFKAIQAGVIVTKNAAHATQANMTVNLVGTPGVIISRASTVGADGYVADNLLYSYGVKTAFGTVYGRGYIVLKNMTTGELTTEYTEILYGTI